MSTYTIRGVDEKTRHIIHDYAIQHNLSTAEAIRNLMMFGKETETKKKYKSLLEAYEKIKFKGGGKNLSTNVDEVIYK